LLEQGARTLKSEAGRFGSRDVADHAMRIQLAARNRDGGRAAAALRRLCQTFQRAPQATEPDPSGPMCR
jgi:hypothetical protein